MHFPKKRSALVIFSLVFLLSFPAWADEAKRWKQIERVISKSGFIYPTIAAELESEFQMGIEVSEEILDSEVAVERELLDLIQSAVFMRHKVGDEALDFSSSFLATPLPPLKKAIYSFARRIVGALLVSGKSNSLNPAPLQFRQRLETTRFGKAFLDRLWNRFYDSNENLRSKNQSRTLVVAFTVPERGMGLDGDLPWGKSMETDFKSFAKRAVGHWGIMTSGNFESKTNDRKRFPGTENIIVSRRADFKAEDCIVVPTLEAALELVGADPQPVYFGGSTLYKLAIDGGYVDSLVATHIYADSDADVRMPEFESKFTLMNSTPVLSDSVSAYPFQFLTYRAKGNSVLVPPRLLRGGKPKA